jgi:L-aminopeptidase/D-esterase-like protein
VPVGEEIPDLTSCIASSDIAIRGTRCDAPTPAQNRDEDSDEGQGSIIVVVATDAPLLPHQLKRIATRVSLGIGRMGGKGENSSGDIFVAFSTANAHAATDTAVTQVAMIPNGKINPLFYATTQATEEAILNAMLQAETLTGANFVRVYALPVDRLMAAMKKYGR